MSIWPLCTGSKVPGYTATRRAGGCVTALRGCSLSRRTASTSLSAWLHRRSLGGFYLDAGPVVYRCRADEVWLPCVDSTVVGYRAPTGSRAAAIRRGSLWLPSPFGGETRERQREGPPGPERLLSGAEGLGVGPTLRAAPGAGPNARPGQGGRGTAACWLAASRRAWHLCLASRPPAPADWAAASHAAAMAAAAASPPGRAGSSATPADPRA